MRCRIAGLDWWQVVVVISLALFIGCSTQFTLNDPQAAGHLLIINRDGGFVCPSKSDDGQRCELPIREERVAREVGYDIQASQLQAQAMDLKQVEQKRRDLEQYLDGMFNQALQYSLREKLDTVPLLISIHGGLNNYRSTVGRAECHYQQILRGHQDPSNPTDKYYPIFFIWNSDGIDSYWNHLTRIRAAVPSKLAKWTAPFYLMSELLASVGNLPKSYIVTSKNSWDSVFKQDYGHYQEFTDPTQTVFFTGNDPDYSHAGVTALWTLTTPARLLTTPFTFTLGKPAWDIMLRRTQSMFVTQADYQNYDPAVAAQAGGAIQVFLERLVQFQNRLKTTHPQLKLETTLIGHSMGGIIANHMVFLEPKLELKRIIHMASADSIRNLMGKIVPYLQSHPMTSYYSVMLHPENESRELSAWGLTPSGSLLVWIDNMYTTPKSLLDKTSGRWENVNKALNLFPREVLKKQMTFKILGLANASPFPAWPQHHGDFDEYQYWRSDFWMPRQTRSPLQVHCSPQS